tara:strand:- start:617 stop:1246 length:630 start_codon:yes stop_codon:yes gene_type:complete
MKKQKKKLNNKNQSIILNKTKEIVKADGWSRNIIDKLIKDGVNKSELIIIFKNDYKKLLGYFLEEINQLLELKVKKINIINFPVNIRIKKILLSRIQILNEDKIFYKKTFDHLLLPQNIKILKKSLYKSVDTMWYLAGDTSTDFNFYTKRIILGGVYTNAIFTFFNNDIEQAEVNIDKNLKKISKLPKLKERFSFIKDNLPIFLKGFIN